MNRHPFDKLIETLKNPREFIANRLYDHPGLFSDKRYLELCFWARMGMRLNLDAPKTFNEKLQWLKLNNRKPVFTTMVDKYAVKKYVADIIGPQYIIPTLGVWEKPEDIDFDSLPERFVLKCNHNSGTGMYICKDKASMDADEVRRGLAEGIAEDYYLRSKEWPYKDVPRRIIAEQFMEENNGGNELTDYKVMCFNGESRLIQVHKGRFGHHTQDFYDTEWNKLAITQPGLDNSEGVMAKPARLEEMLRLSDTLSTGIPFLRVDWYIIDGRLYFGELTFFDASGYDAFNPEEWDYKLGEWTNLNIC